MKVRIFSFSLLACFMVMGMLFTGTKAFSVETNEVSPGQDFTPSVKPIGRIQGKWEQIIEDKNVEGEQGSQFVARRLRFGAKGKVLPTVGYLIQFDAESTVSTGLVDLTYAWITLGVVDKYLNSRLGVLNAPKTMEGTSSGKFLMQDIASTLGSSNVVIGGMLYGSALNSQLHYYFWFGNSPAKWGSGSNKAFKTADGYEHYQLGFRVQYDIFRKWNHGGEWLQTKDMAGTIGISVNYTPTYNDGGINNIEDEIFLHVNLGFTASLFYLQSGISMAFATAPAEYNETSEDQSHQMYLGAFVDVAITATTWLVPAVRFEYKNAGLGNSTVEGQSTAPSKAENMNLLVVLSIFPGSGGHKFKVQPEFLYRVMETDSDGNQVKKEDGSAEYNNMVFRLGFTLNF